ncbi:alpha/beta hydrolase family esterase [Streptomyces sp. NPDC004111]|uniref:alpha/beta hydrolase family esterase n=1 Tax=Streptomyces sp. NPDC004111 TaxID=3364690 RepID=UPI0036BBF2C8
MRTSLGKALYVPACSALVAVLATLSACSSPTGKPPPQATSPKPQSPSLRPDVPRPGDQKVTMLWKGKERTYTVHAPPGYSPGKPLPLVVAMHMYPGTSDAIAALSGLSKKADAKNFLVAYPEGLNGGYNALICCGSEDDVGFIKAMVGRLTTTWKADPTRIYATGISNGADMSYKLAVELHELFAAVAPVSGAYAGDDAADASYVPKSPVSVMTFIGGKDRVETSAESGVQTWQQRMVCIPASPQKLTNGITKTAATCRDTSDFVTYRLPEMGHSWPGATAGVMADEEAGINATDLMWDFFAAHRKKTS